LKTNDELQPSTVPIYKGMKLYLTKNVRKANDYVNGMLCEVENYYAHENCLRVRTKTGYRLMITPWTDVDHGKVVYFPIRLGYASTIHKAQGDEFKHITIWLDIPSFPAAAYTALSRVETGNDYLLGGIMTRKHFVPATNK
jgi:ATP-dependent exoDNAse (exonuclease V) alpha subunit